MNELPNIVRARLKATAAGDHPDPDLLAAFAEQALAEQERSTVLAHLSRCSECREVLAVAMPSLSTGALDTASSIDTATRRWFHGTALRWAAAATCVVIVGSAVLMKRDFMMKQTSKTVALREDSISSEVANYAAAERANNTEKKQFEMAASPRAIPAPARDEETRQQQVPPSTRPQDAKKVLSPKPAPPAAPPILPRRMRPEFAPSAEAGGGAVAGAAGAAGTFAPAPTRNEPSDILSFTENKIDKEAASAKPTAAAEQIQITAAAPVIETDAAGSRDKQELPGKAKAPSGVAMYDALVTPAAQESSAQTVLTKEAARRAELKRMETLRPPVSRWTISSDGQLQHSTDSGKTWQPVVVAENTTFRALSANGPDLWVGGASGLLYHSSDAGAHWTQVKPATADATLTADIAAIEFIDVRQGKITTSAGEVWITTDGGQTWRRQS